MFNATFKTTFMSTLAAAVVVTGLSVSPSHADGGGAGDNYSTISTVKKDGTKTTLRWRNGSKIFTVIRTRHGKLINKRKVNKRGKPFITIFNRDGTSRTVTTPSKPGRDFVTRHNPDGTTTTVTKPSKPGKAFITMHNPDGTSVSVGR